MNYYQARQRQIDQRWDFTSMNDEVVHPVGYCHAYRKFVPERCLWIPEDFRVEYAEHENAKQAPFRNKYHDVGHTTKEEAERCWYEYGLDQLRSSTSLDAQHLCAICGAWTQRALSSRHGDAINLCAEHANRDGFAQVRPFVPGIAIMSSW